MAKVDVSRIRKDYPKFLLIGAFDKTIMHLGPEAMIAEFERLLPVMKQGGFIPCVDHRLRRTYLWITIINIFYC